MTFCTGLTKCIHTMIRGSPNCCTIKTLVGKLISWNRNYFACPEVPQVRLGPSGSTLETCLIIMAKQSRNSHQWLAPTAPARALNHTQYSHILKHCMPLYVSLIYIYQPPSNFSLMQCCTGKSITPTKTTYSTTSTD